MSQLLPGPVWRPSDADPERLWRAEAFGSGFAVTVDGELLGRWPDDLEAARLVRGDVEIWAAAHAVGCVVIHACVVAHQGVGLLLPGPSMAGKTTMALALVQAGAEYCSDEFALLDDRGSVHPYPRRPSVRRSGADGPSVRHLDLGELQGRVRHLPVPVGLIADVRYAGPMTAGCGAPPTPAASLDVEQLAAPLAALALVANAVAARTQPEVVLAAASAVAGRARAVRGTRGEADEAAALLLALLRSKAGGLHPAAHD